MKTLSFALSIKAFLLGCFSFIIFAESTSAATITYTANFTDENLTDNKGVQVSIPHFSGTPSTLKNINCSVKATASGVINIRTFGDENEATILTGWNLWAQVSMNDNAIHCGGVLSSGDFHTQEGSTIPINQTYTDSVLNPVGSYNIYGTNDHEVLVGTAFGVLYGSGTFNGSINGTVTIQYITDEGGGDGEDGNNPPDEEPQKPDLSLSNIRVTQAVFDSDIDGDKVTDLVKDRKTAVLVDIELLQGEVNDSFLVGGQYTDSLGEHDLTEQRVSFGPGKTIISDVALFFTPEKVGKLEISPSVDVKNEIDEGDKEDNNSINHPVISVVHDTINITIPYVRINDCKKGSVFTPFDSCYGGLSTSAFSDHVENSNTYLKAIFPLAESDLKGPQLEPLKGSRINSAESGIQDDLERVWKMARHSREDSKRAIGVVPKGYFIYHDDPESKDAVCCNNIDPNTGETKRICGVVGIHIPHIPDSVLVTEGYWTLTAHELGHSFGFIHDEAGVVTIKDDNDPKRCTTVVSQGYKNVEGYWVQNRMPIYSAYDIMGGIPPHKEEIFVDNTLSTWISTEHWGKLLKQFKIDTPDPELLLVTGEVLIDGTANISSMSVAAGFPNSPPKGLYTLVLQDTHGNSLMKVPFDISFQLIVEPFRSISTEKAKFLIAVPYLQGTTSVSVISPAGDTLDTADPMIEVVSDSVMEIINVPDQCFSENKVLIKKDLEENLGLYTEYVTQNDYQLSLYFLDIIKRKMEEIGGLLDVCDGESIYSIADILATIDSVANKLEFRNVLDGDLDRDGDVDQDDLNILLASRNQPATGPDDPKDLDGDGAITSLDARKLTLLCTRPRCATE